MSRIRLFVAALTLFAAPLAGAAVPSGATPSAAARAKAQFATTFYVMHWNKPHVLDYAYDPARSELSLHAEHRGQSKNEQAVLNVRLAVTKPGRYAIPSQGKAAFTVLACPNVVEGDSYVQITRIDATRIEGTFHLQGRCSKSAAMSETLRNGKFSLVFDAPKAAR